MLRQLKEALGKVDGAASVMQKVEALVGEESALSEQFVKQADRISKALRSTNGDEGASAKSSVRERFWLVDRVRGAIASMEKSHEESNGAVNPNSNRTVAHC